MKIYYPPKPTLITLTQPLFSSLERREDVVCELKYNGSRLILYRFVDPHFNSGGRYEFFNRHGERMKNYASALAVVDQLDKIAWKGNCVLDGELLHFKTKNVKHRVILFDVYEWNGELTTNWTFKRRRALLEEKTRLLRHDTTPTELKDRIQGIESPLVLLAPEWVGGIPGCFRKVFDNWTKYEEIEGLVIKSLESKVVLGSTASKEVPTMWKVRKPGPTYRY